MTTFKRIRFVTDSTCDLPRDLVEKHGIGVVPCYLNFGTESYADGIEISREAFYDRLTTARPLPTTSAPPPGVAERIINQTFEGADHLVIISVPMKLSGVLNTLRLAASAIPPERLTLIDSGTTTMGLGWQVLIGAEVAEATGDLDAVLSAIQRARESQRMIAALPTLDNLRHSGRVSWAAASIGTLLNIKPLIEVRDGEVHSIARIRTFGRATDELIELARAEAPLDRLALLHANNAAGAQAMLDRLKDVAPPDTHIVNVTPVLGTYAGSGALGVATVRSSWRH